MRILPWTHERSPNLGARALGEGTAALCRRLWGGEAAVQAQQPHGVVRHPLLGLIRGSWVAWANDERLRSTGSSGGALSAVSAWLLRSDMSVLVGEPCEAAAVRVMAQVDGAQAPVILTFFCAGTPSQKATEQLWLQDSAEHPMDDEQSRGDHLGQTTQWRCKICPDGVEESADVIVADCWSTDGRGHPTFEEADGVSALIARTELGARVVAAAVAAGVIELQPLDPDELAGVQPFEAKHRSTLWGRLVGARAAGLKVPAYSGLGLWCLAAQQPRENLGAAGGTFSRRRATGRGSRESRGDIAH